MSRGWFILALLAASAAVTAGCGSGGRASDDAVAPAVERGGFTDIAEQAGVGSFVHTDGGSGRKYFVEQMGGGVGVLDYDGDGLKDLFFASGAPLPGFKGKHPGSRLFRNVGAGRFVDVTAEAIGEVSDYVIGVAVADYDGDGDDDLYLTCFGPNRLLRNDGGRFTDVTAAAGVGDPRLSSSAAWGDFDGDGDLDLYVANYAKYRLEDDLWCSKFEGHKSYCGPTLYDAEVDTLYRNEGSGRFTDVSDASGIRKSARTGLGVIWLDYNDDGRQDIFVANDQTANLLWRNDGSGRFTDQAMEMNVAFGEEGTARAGMGIDAADYDNDGDFEVVITNFSEESNSLFRWEESSFRDVSFPAGIGAATLMYLGFGTGFLDYDRDGWLDLFFANGHVLDDIEKYSDAVTWKQPSQLFRNQGDGSFADVSSDAGIAANRQTARGAAFVDWDNDGRTDIAVSVLRGKPMLLHNQAAPGARWLGVELKGLAPNTRAIGAVVTLESGGITQKRVCRVNHSYLSSSDPRMVFGLGQASRPEKLRVRWPSGAESVIERPETGAYVTVEEPAPGA